MTDYPPELLAHLTGDATTVCHCWRVIRRDGAALGFTDHDGTLAIDGVSCEPETGLSASEAVDSLGLAADTVDVEGALASDRISDEDLAAGLYDGATVEAYLVNWREPAQFALLRRARIGKITRSDGRFSAELVSLAGDLDRPNGRYFRRSCDAELGDARCGVDLGAAGFTASGTVLGVKAADTLLAGGLEGFADGWFSGGLLTWTSGAQSGRTMRVVAHTVRPDGVGLTLWQDGAPPAEAGAGFTVTAGCDKRFATCKAKFANALNFRGFPHMPGNDAAYAYVTEGQDLDGGALTP